ncbi:hypothetical protein AB2L27_06570 [Kineococcus sp. LSe6-4]|uniref:Uncharacterized protein n=1 Tax=Kineococcus halophytocola TaxID=3234027 RepID=A0ABV4GYN2_9ACTN
MTRVRLLPVRVENGDGPPVTVDLARATGATEGISRWGAAA